MEEKQKSGLSVAGMVLGIVAICLCWIPILNYISFIYLVDGPNIQRVLENRLPADLEITFDENNLIKEVRENG